MSISLNSDVTLSPTLLCVSSLTQTLQMPLLYGIITVIDRSSPLHLLTSHFFLYKLSVVLSPQINRYSLQWDSFLSVLTVLSIMTQVCIPKPNQMSARDNDPRACRWNWSTWEANIRSPSPKGMNSKWVLLFLLFLLFIYFHLITWKKKM